MPGFLCDLHIHSCLSPCGDEEMTPYNLVNMAKVMGLDILALTDHNSSLNCPAAARAGRRPPRFRRARRPCCVELKKSYMI